MAKIDYLERAFNKYRKGLPFIDDIQAFFRNELLYYKSNGVPYVKILTAHNETVCAECKALEGRVYTIEEALEKMPLPVRTCKNDDHEVVAGFGWCRCTYVPVFEPGK